VRDATQTAVVVTVTEVEPVVAEHRTRFDPAAGWGVPAHVTVLFPFVEPAALDDEAVRRLGDAVGGVSAFSCSFDRCEWFDRDVLWLAPVPAQPFRDLTWAVWRAFPDLAPYGGAHADLEPHLTVGRRPDGDEPAALEQLRSVEAAVAPRLPVPAYVDRVQLLAGSPEPGSWRALLELPLQRTR
jgi:2'-5' RNA ligase